jgi:hypothetical protein
LGIAWLVIVAAEMLTGRPGVGGFLWQEYNSLIYSHIILCILVIGVVGFILDRLMSLAEKNLNLLASLPMTLVRVLMTSHRPAEAVVAVVSPAIKEERGMAHAAS